EKANPECVQRRLPEGLRRKIDSRLLTGRVRQHRARLQAQALPNVPRRGNEKTLASNHMLFVPILLTGPFTLGRCEPPPTPARSPVITGLIGVPDCADVMPDICQPSSIF